MLIVTFISIFFGLCLTWVFPFIPDGVNEYVVYPCLLLAHIVIAASFLKKNAVRPGVDSIFGVDSLFYLFFYILFIFPYVSFFLGFSDIYYNRFISDIYIEHTNRAVVSSTLALCFFDFGFRVCKKYVRNENSGASIFDLNVNAGYRFLYVSLGIFVLLIALFFATGAYSSLLGSYTGLSVGDSTSDGVYYLLTHFSMLIVGSVMGIRVAQGKGSLVLYAYALPPILWSLVMLITGDRNSFLLIAMIPLLGVSTYLYRIRWPVWVAIGLSAFLVYQSIELSRSSGARNLSDFVSALFDVASTSEGNGLGESSFSLTTITSRASFHEYPDGGAIYFGKFKLIGFMGVVPYSRSVFFDPEKSAVTSADYISEIVLGQARSWSIGTNVVSDVIVDVGVIFLPMLMVFLGGFGGWVYAKSKNKIMFSSVLIYLFVASLYFEYPRYSYDFGVRGVAWLFLMLWLVGRFGKSAKFKN